MSALGQQPTKCGAAKISQGLPAVSFVYLSVECPFNKFYGINGRTKLSAKLLDRFFHRRRQVSPPVNNLTHGFFDGCYHLLDGDVAVSLHHSLTSSLGLPQTGPCCLLWWRLASSGAGR